MINKEIGKAITEALFNNDIKTESSSVECLKDGIKVQEFINRFGLHHGPGKRKKRKRK